MKLGFTTFLMIYSGVSYLRVFGIQNSPSQFHSTPRNAIRAFGVYSRRAKLTLMSSSMINTTLFYLPMCCETSTKSKMFTMPSPLRSGEFSPKCEAIKVRSKMFTTPSLLTSVNSRLFCPRCLATNVKSKVLTTPSPLASHRMRDGGDASSHSRMVPSELPLASVLPSGEKTKCVIAPHAL